MSGKPRKRRSRWRWLVLGLVMAAVLFGAAGFLPSERARQVGSGVLALLLVAGTAFYGARKWFFVARLGSLHAWMVGHVALGGALLVGILLHADVTNLGEPGWVLLGLVLAQIASGLWGLVEQSKAPGRFAAVVKGDAGNPTTVRRRLALLQGGVRELLGRRGPALRGWFEERYGAVLAGGARSVPALEGFPPADARVATDLHERAAEIARLTETLSVLEPAESASRRWSWVHVPIATALVTLVVLHVIGWLVYG